ncbi:helix-turn-helix domain-containing protein [Klebsiella variicola]|uniref:helix-turn-helix domain-containing protein n=1 Tax=Klebsiella variicola TaxID=244366 RepID=UPI003F68AEE4
MKNLREIRIKKGITQERLAQALKRPQSFVAKVESGERRLGKVRISRSFLPADSLIKISRIWADFFPANTSNQPI